ncbi:hypothetical protein DUI87_08005 [Hirundo rustica rustica]|uniref:Reverse transcriptase domain-containing protein n=1 Tax=Hirundo rustica rustica TaxID=333673 RepID=A0A3M0KT00_HIRRU|nr:hypothetical protein DUI87_08005 [Hirundo rustica rustica]
MRLLLNQMCVLLVEDTDKAELPNAFFLSVLLLLSALKSLRPLEEKKTGERKTEGIIYLNFSKAFDTVCCNIPLGKLKKDEWDSSRTDGPTNAWITLYNYLVDAGDTSFLPIF